MSKFKKITQKNFITVMNNITNRYEKADKNEKEAWVESMNEFLDNLHDDDFFGTEGQNDPRGDHRD